MYPVLAEISDKMPETAELWILAICMSTVAIGVCRWRRWLYCLAFPLTGLWAVGGYREFIADIPFRNAVIIELGHTYLTQAVITSWAPLTALLVHFTITQTKKPNQPLQRNASTGSVSNFESPARRG